MKVLPTRKVFCFNYDFSSDPHGCLHSSFMEFHTIRLSQHVLLLDHRLVFYCSVVAQSILGLV